MELRLVRYYLALCREGSISKAASYLHISQPTLSRQLGDMEDELGVSLFKRGKSGIVLTEEGTLFKKRCEEITSLVEKSISDIRGESQGGSVYVGAAEAVAFASLAKAAAALKKKLPLFSLNMVAGDSVSTFEGLRKGIYDFGLTFGDVDGSLYESFEVGEPSKWGIVMREDDPLSSLESVRRGDVADRPLILSRQGLESGLLLHWLGKKREELDIAATYNLGYNVAFMVNEGLGYAFALKELLPEGQGALVFKPLEPGLSMRARLVYRRDAVFSYSASSFLQYLKEHEDLAGKVQK